MTPRGLLGEDVAFVLDVLTLRTPETPGGAEWRASSR